ncbi:hypothetical protein [Flexithrix dorotheae]|uniref:hypothetical protein n=1 Tax=Flexithrix dorotheae TaxID=70993 RepID=UPI00037E14A1|nr:hypothetical protein [Flexithrix dorotheae]
MIKFDYDFLYQIYLDIFDVKAIELSIYGFKTLAICLILINWYHKFFMSATFKGSKNPPLSPADIYQALLIVVLIISYDHLLAFIDMVMGNIENTYRGFEVEAHILQEIDEPVIKPELETEGFASLKEAAEEIVYLTKAPAHFLGEVMAVIVGIVDLLVYGVFLAERFFFMAILRIFGAFALACYPIEKMQKWFWNWLAVYVALYLLAIPYFLINAFCNAIYMQAKDNAAMQVVDPIISTGVGGLVMLVVALFVIWLKISLFKKSHQMIFRIFN